MKHDRTTQQLRTTVETLCSPDFSPAEPRHGRRRGGWDHLRDQLEALGLTPVGEDGFDQPIPDIGGTNLLGMVPGTGDRFVMLAAHYDACLSPNPGADDNAAAVAIALDVAGRLLQEELDRSVIIALFDAEEPPYFLTPEMGSQWFVDHPTVPLERLDMMVCLDLVGHRLGPEEVPAAVGESVFALGAEKSTGTGPLLEALPARDGIAARRIDNYIIEPMSDYDAFMNASVPFLFYSCGRWEHYHMPSDTPDRLDYEKMAALSEHLTDVLVALSNRPDVPEYVPDGVDDAATVRSLEAVMVALAEVSFEAEMAEAIVAQLRSELDISGLLGDQERMTIRYLVGQIEMALS